MMKRVRYYTDVTDDFESATNENYSLPENYKWVRQDIISKILSAVIYATALIFSFFYCRLWLHLKIRGKEKLKDQNGGYFIFSNHTQPIGDVFTPAHCAFPKRIYTVVSTANYTLPIIGKILPFLGALPIEKSLHGLKELNLAIKQRLEEGHPIVIYPEAHVWQYYTDIRPFPDTSFKFPVKLEYPSFAMTVTYKRSKIFKKPIMEVFIDGPFYGCGDSVKEKTAELHSKVYNTMCERSKNSDFNYIEYVLKEKT